MKIKKAYCEDCGIEYPFGLDLILPDQQWNWICPNTSLLCPNCICKRAHKLKGSTVILAWIDGFDWAAKRPEKWLKKKQKSRTRKSLAKLRKP